MNAKILALPNAAEAEPRPHFDLANATEAEEIAYRAGIQKVLDDLEPVWASLQRHAKRNGVEFPPRLSVAS